MSGYSFENYGASSSLLLRGEALSFALYTRCGHRVWVACLPVTLRSRVVSSLWRWGAFARRSVSVLGLKVRSGR